MAKVSMMLDNDSFNLSIRLKLVRDNNNFSNQDFYTFLGGRRTFKVGVGCFNGKLNNSRRWTKKDGMRISRILTEKGY